MANLIAFCNRGFQGVDHRGGFWQFEVEYKRQRMVRKRSEIGFKHNEEGLKNSIFHEENAVCLISNIKWSVENGTEREMKNEIGLRLGRVKVYQSLNVPFCTTRELAEKHIFWDFCALCSRHH